MPLNANDLFLRVSLKTAPDSFNDKVKKSLIVINKDTGQILINLLHC